MQMPQSVIELQLLARNTWYVSHRENGHLMNSVGVVSDDLTSALESAGAFAGSGIESCVALGIEAVGKLRSVPCVAVDANTRVLDEPAAKSKIVTAIEALSDRNTLVKTMDSTLRGHVAMEIEAALAASNRYVAIVAPAFPSEGRTTIGGCQYVAGVQVAETATQNDPDWPITQSNICEVLSHGAFDLVQSIGNPVEANLTTRIGEYSHAQQRVALVIDATTQEHLAQLCQLIEKPEQVLWVGSPGLLIALADQLKIDAQRTTIFPSRSTGPILVGVGSVNPVSRKQLSALRLKRGTPIVTIEPELASEDPQRAAEEAIGSLSKDELASGIIVVTTLLSQTKCESPQLAHASISDVTKIGTSLTQAVGAAILNLSRRLGSSCYVLTGGDTALGVSQQLGAHGFTVLGMLEMGIPIATLNGTIGTVITKAGGFGDPELLVRACDYIQQTVQNRRNLD
jgi:D-threonate/D-erythronate kinase